MGSRLVINEKRPMKSKGFGGVLFQFFDWNRMLSKKKKKLLSNHKLLLPPSASRKFDGDEKMPKAKHFLVADENLDCFPISQKHDGHINQMRDAGPVAKLMGLESLPIVHHKKPSEPSVITEFNSDPSDAYETTESRHQKLQRTGAISSSSEPSHSNKRVRRQHHHKIASPVKSPRLLSKRSTSRLMEAATKILEPRLLHSQKSAKCSLTYTGSNEKVTKDALLGDSGVGPSRSFCGLNGSMELRLNDAENKMKLDAKNPLVIPKGKERPTSLDVPKINVERRACGINERKNYMQDGRKREILRQNQLPVVKGKVVYASRRCSNEMSNGLNNVKESGTERLEIESNGTERKNKGPKRRPNGYSHIENGKATSSTFGKELNARNNLINGKGKGVIDNRSINHSPVKSGFINQEESNDARGSEGNGIVSFTFSSLMRRSSRPIRNQDVLEKKRCVGKPIHSTSRSKTMASDDEKNRSKVSQGEAIPRGDSLSVILRRKIEELNYLDRDEFAAGGALKGRSTASILGELISALRIGQENTAFSGSTSISDHITSPGQMVKSNSIQIEVESGRAAANLVSDGDQPSPMSILEVSFSNGSCLSGSANGSSGHKPDLGSTDIRGNIQPLNLDADLLDSASSFHLEKLDVEKTHGSVTRNFVEDAVRYEIWFSECKLSTEAKSNARLLIDNISLSITNQKDSFIFDTLEAIITGLGITDTNNGSQFRRLLFDHMIEYFDSQCIGLLTSGLKISLLTRREELTRAVCDEIEGWNGLGGKEVDNLVDKDLRDSNGKWTKFRHEAFVTCVQIENELLHELVGEIVTDLCS